jgi:enoyl-CoA hydratase
MKENVNESGVRFEVIGKLGVVTLDRPRAINALTHAMVLEIAARLDEWESDPEIARVLLEGAGDRGFCAGGDVVAVREDALAGGTASIDFWRDEYTLNARIARYPKPIVAFMDGLVLGGGVGLGAHARHRVVTEDSRVGMPETTIGFVPDVGGTWLLSHAPGELGTVLALTAEPVDAADAILVGARRRPRPSAQASGAAGLRSRATARSSRSHPCPRRRAGRRWRRIASGSTSASGMTM